MSLSPARAPRCTCTTLASLFTSTKENGERPGLFDAAFLATRYRSEFAVLELPAIVRKLAIPVVYVVGTVLGKYKNSATLPRRFDNRSPAT